jgi:hypothetical protein
MLDGLELLNEPEVYESRTSPIDALNIPFHEGRQYTSGKFPGQFENRANAIKAALQDYGRPVSMRFRALLSSVCDHFGTSRPFSGISYHPIL